ncbi:MAG: TonB family protein [Acidobacteria bacterium]|nr:TonB family protein [Acidobacteriota bacterium]
MRPLTASAILLTFLGVTAAIAGFEVFAQSRFATVSGTVVDQSGGVLVATLVVSNLQTNAKNEVRTNQTGFYEVVGLPAGDYELEVRQLGFQMVKEPLSLGVGEARQRNFTLQVSAVQETITMTGGAAAAVPAPPRVASAPARRPCPNPAVGGCIRPPVKVKDVRPIYPALLSEAGVEGVVLLVANIASDGKTNVVRVVSSPHPELERAAIDAVSQWEFAPTLLNGAVIDTPMNISVTFKLPEAAAQP